MKKNPDAESKKSFFEETQQLLNKMSELQVDALENKGVWKTSKFQPNDEFLESRKQTLLKSLSEIEKVIKAMEEKIHKREITGNDEIEDLSQEMKEPELSLDPYLEEIQKSTSGTHEVIQGMMVEVEYSKDRLNDVNDVMQKQNLILESQILAKEKTQRKLEEMPQESGCIIN
jgi:hypothetical protein